VEIYLDENLPANLVRALDLIQDGLNKQNGTSIKVIPLLDKFGRGAKDEVWIPQVPKSIVITKDYRIQRTRHQKDLYERFEIGMIFIKPPSKKGLSFMELTKLLIRHWEDINKVASKPKFPFAYKVGPKSKLVVLDDF